MQAGPTTPGSDGPITDKYDYEKPVVTMLREIPPKEIQPRSEVQVIDVHGDTRDWAWAQETYGVGYQRGESGSPDEPSPSLRLIEVHEYEGPPTLDVWVVDSAGLPVIGVPFYYYHPDAPAIDSMAAPAEGGDGQEWYSQGVVKSTGPDGRLSFAAAGRPCTPDECPGAIWPKGKGDVLEGLGLLAGTHNRHLNGMWQLVTRRALSPPVEPQPEPEPAPKPEPEPVPVLNPGRNRIPLTRAAPGADTQWEMEVEYRPGARIIAGTFPYAGIEVTVTDPWGNAQTTTSGSKLEHGVGGFEVLAPHPVTYTLTFLDQRFLVLVQDGATFVNFREVVQSRSQNQSPNQSPNLNLNQSRNPTGGRSTL